MGEQSEKRSIKLSMTLKMALITYLYLFFITLCIEYILILGVPGSEKPGVRYVLDSYIDLTGERTLSAAAAILEDSDLSRDELSDRIAEFSLAQDEKSVHAGLLYRDTSNEWVYLHADGSEYRDVFSRIRLSDESGQGSLVFEGEVYRIFFAPTAIEPLYLFVGVNRREFIEASRDSLDAFIVINILYQILLFAAALFFSWNTLKPVRGFADRIRTYFPDGYSGTLAKRLDDPHVLDSMLDALVGSMKNKMLDDEHFQEQKSELFHLLADGAARSHFAPFLKALRTMFDSEVAIFTLVHDRHILNIFFNIGDNSRIRFPVDIQSEPISPERMLVINKLGNRELFFLEKPRNSVFGNSMLNRSFIFSVKAGSEVVAVLQVGGRAKPYEQEDMSSIERIFISIKPALVTIALEEVLLKEKRAALVGQRTSEERYRKMFDESQDMILTVDGSTMITRINPAGASVLGYSSPAEIEGRNFRDFFVQPDAYSFVADSLLRDGFVRDVEIILKTGTDRKIICLMSATAEFDSMAVLSGYSASIKDISERVELDSQLWSANLELASLNEELQDTHIQMVQNEKLASIGQLAAGVAHEINNPLGFISSNMNTMRQYFKGLISCVDTIHSLECGCGYEEILEKNRYEHIRNDTASILEETFEGLQRILNIVENLKTFSRVDSVGTGWEDTDMKEAILNTLVIARNEYKYHAEVTTEFGEVEPVQCRPGEIKQVFLNIIVNAAQATGEKMESGGQIHISLRKDGEMARIEVDDNGPGVPEDKRLQVFDPFFTTKPVGKGTGLGLGISYDIIVNKHHGKIFVESSPFGGARFVVMLPLVQRDERAEELSADDTWALEEVDMGE